MAVRSGHPQQIDSRLRQQSVSLLSCTGRGRATLWRRHKYGCDAAVIWLRMGSREARSLGAVYMGGRRVQQPAQEEPPRPAALSCDRDSHEPVPEHASRRRTELYRKPLLMPALSTSCCSGGACNHAPDTSSFDTGAGAEGEEGDGIVVGGLEGFRLIDIALLNEFLQTKVVCRQCAESSLQDQLRQFAAFADGRGADTVTGHLQAYLHNLSRHATRKNAGLCGVQIVSETLEGGAQSTFRVECVHHQRQHELRYNKAHRGAKISPVELVTSATVNTVDQQTGRVRRGEKLAEVNVRIAAAFDNIGRGAVDAANVCAFMNLPLSGKEARAFERVFQSAERAIVGPAYEAAAHASFEAVQETVRQRQLASTDPRFAPLVDAETGEQLVGFVAAGDGSWCKKGSGHKYDSLGGTYTLYDAETNKVIFFINLMTFYPSSQQMQPLPRPPRSLSSTMKPQAAACTGTRRLSWQRRQRR